MVKEYIENIYKTELLLYQYQEVRGNLEPKLEKGMIELNKKIDKEIITTSVSFNATSSNTITHGKFKVISGIYKKNFQKYLLILRNIGKC